MGWGTGVSSLEIEGGGDLEARKCFGLGAGELSDVDIGMLGACSSTFAGGGTGELDLERFGAIVL